MAKDEVTPITVAKCNAKTALPQNKKKANILK